MQFAHIIELLMLISIYSADTIGIVFDKSSRRFSGLCFLKEKSLIFNPRAPPRQPGNIKQNLLEIPASGELQAIAISPKMSLFVQPSLKVLRQREQSKITAQSYVLTNQ